MTTYRIIVPLTKDGAPDVAEYVERQLMLRFGGVTVFVSAIGAYANSLRTVERKSLAFYVALVALGALADWLFTKEKD